ncbi:uncharacterized protein LOC106075369 [Biomphalaria glabrata]|uniref:Uncharacterized protein LOC106075369 n=1 Tax=Biomphalaria glabrata TaxID=6526 RepID=A0A9W3BEC1_BIOGL|nr:uncharacterized protein LOC106075369 [Biomphalaria glabrata]
MTRPSTMTIRLTVFLIVMIVVTAQEAPSTRNLLNFLSMVSGVFHNKKQVNRELVAENSESETEHDFLKVIWQVVNIPQLAPAITMYHEERDGGDVFRKQIWVISEANQVIHIQPLNVTSVGSDDWSNVVLEPAKDQCEIVFQPVEPDVYMGTIPDCTRDSEVTQLPYYGFTVTCHSVNTLIYFQSSREAISKLPYVFKNTQRFLLPDSLTQTSRDFVPPCGYN